MGPQSIHPDFCAYVHGSCQKRGARGAESMVIARDCSERRAMAPRRRRADGFTLIELLVVLAILGLLVTLAGPRVIALFGNAKTKIAHQSVAQLRQVLDFYKLDMGTYPTTDQGLAVLLTPTQGAANWRGPYLKDNKSPVDPWGRPYLYHNPSTRPGFDYDLYSLGGDGQPGGSGENADVFNE
jgi:general secretion pathway protein G